MNETIPCRNILGKVVWECQVGMMEGIKCFGVYLLIRIWLWATNEKLPWSTVLRCVNWGNFRKNETYSRRCVWLCQSLIWSIVCTSEHQWLREREFRLEQVQRSGDDNEKCFREESLLGLEKQRLKEVTVTLCECKTGKTPGREGATYAKEQYWHRNEWI